MDKTLIKFDDTEIEKHKFHQCSPIQMNDSDINKIIVSNKFLSGKQDFKYFIGFKDSKKTGLYAYSFQKRVNMEQILLKLNECIF